MIYGVPRFDRNIFKFRAVEKRLITYIDNAFRYIDAQKVSTIVERRRPDSQKIFRHFNVFKSGTTVKRVSIYNRNTFRDAYVSNSRTSGESVRQYSGNSVRHDEFCHRLASDIQIVCIVKRICVIIAERYLTPRRQIGYIDTGKPRATVKRVF